MKIIFFGEDAFSATVLNSILSNGYDVAMIVTPYYEDFLYKRLQFIAEKNKIPFFRETDIHSPAFIDKIKQAEPDIIITAHFKKLLKKELIAIPKIACLNLHPSLLPLYRGMSPQHWPIINGDKETGISVHYIEEGIDTGNILVQKKIPISPDTYVYDLQMQMLPYYSTVIVEAIKKIESGDAVGEKQDANDGSYYGKFKQKDSQITNATSKAKAYNLIRAASKPYLGAYFDNYKIWKAHTIDDPKEKKIMSIRRENGLYFEADGHVYLRLHDGVLAIDSYEQIKK